MTENVNEHTQGHLLGAADIRRIAADAGISPTKKFGQNFVIDPGTVRRIVREAGVTADDHVLEVGPGLGSLTLAILETGATMTPAENHRRIHAGRRGPLPCGQPRRTYRQSGESARFQG